MSNLVAIVSAIVLTAFCWGSYGPVLRWGGDLMGTPGHAAHLRPFICVGLAYFVIAVLAPTAYIVFHPEKGHWSLKGIVWSLIAGALGAIGALGIILAFSNGGVPILVMPLVFGGAPVVNTFFTMFTNKSYRNASPMFYSGLVLVALGATTVLVFRPTPLPPPKPAAVVVEQHSGYQPAPAETSATAPAATAVVPTAPAATATPEPIATSAPTESTPAETATPPAETAHAAAPHGTAPHTAGASHGVGALMMVLVWVLVTALSWGVYGPILHWGQAAMGHSRLRPLICVGVAYFLIAVLIPTGILQAQGEPGGWDYRGTLWSLAAGAAGAVGALGIILAFASGGRPIYVMPLVFGGAPIVNTFTTMLFARGTTAPSAFFFAGLIMTAFGAVMVLIFAPAAPKPPAQSASAPPAPPPTPAPAAPAGEEAA